MAKLIFCCALLQALVLTALAIPSVNNFEKKLYDDLFVNRVVETHVRPVNNSDDAITVEVGVSMVQLVDVDEEKDAMKVNSWMIMVWSDYNLQWKPSDYGGIEIIHVHPNKIWIPDITLYNNADSRDSDISFDTLAIVFSNGTVLWVPPTSFHTICKVDIRYFPYDEQHCTIKMGSWTYHNKEISLQLSERPSMDDYFENSVWKLEGMKNEKHTKKYPCCPNSYDDVEFTLHLTRRASYFKMTLVVPSIIAMVLVLVTFYLPPSAPERLQLGGLIAVFQMILLTNIIWEIPSNGSSLPAIVLFNGVTMIFVGLSIALSVVMWRLTRHSNRTPVPSLVRSVTSAKVGRILCLHTKSKTIQDTKEAGVDGPLQSGDSEWFMVAAILNRIFFIIYLFIYILLIAVAFI